MGVAPWQSAAAWNSRGYSIRFGAKPVSEWKPSIDSSSWRPSFQVEIPTAGKSNPACAVTAFFI